MNRSPPTDTPVPAVAIVVIEKVWNSGSNEWGKITNIGSEPADMSRWHLYGSRDHADSRDDYLFPSGYILPPGQTVTLYSGAEGIDNPPLEIYWAKPPVWNNDGATAFLADSQGNVVDDYEY